MKFETDSSRTEKHRCLKIRHEKEKTPITKTQLINDEILHFGVLRVSLTHGLEYSTKFLTVH